MARRVDSTTACLLYPVLTAGTDAGGVGGAVGVGAAGAVGTSAGLVEVTAVAS